MRKMIVVFLIGALSLLPTGCSDLSASGSVSVGDTTVTGSIGITHKKKAPAPLKQDAIVSASQTNNVLIDLPPGFTYNPANPPQSVVTITTDTGLTFSQTFNLVPADASGFAPAAAGTQTYAFAAQDPAAVSSFVQSAANNATSTVAVDVQSKVWFQGPTDGGTYTIIGRDYNSSAGVEGDGSATYTAPRNTGGGTRCPGGRCPNQ